MSGDKFPLLTKEPQIIKLSEKIGNHTVYMYRDAPDDFAFGGNKVRFFEYLIPSILNEKPDVLVTSGSIYSNHIRVTAEVANRLGLQCELLITADELPEELSGNLKLAANAGANITCIGTFAAMLKIEAFVEELKSKSRKVFLIPNGGHTPGAVRAYSEVITKTMGALSKNSISPESIFLPCASGTTQAGVLCGAASLKLPPVISFAVANKPVRAKKGISNLIENASSYLPSGFIPGEVNVFDCGKNNYGIPDDECLELRSSLYKQDGILLDPVYNIIAFYGMTRHLASMPGNGDVLYINTGGLTALLP